MLNSKGTFVKRFVPFLKYHTPALLWGVFVFVLLLLPIDSTEADLFMGVIPFDKVVHFVLFTLFALFCRVGWAKWFGSNYLTFKANLLTIIWSLSLALITEITQGFTTYRTFSMADIVADGFGMLFGLIVFVIIYKL